jgi:hypothetical protein
MCFEAIKVFWNKNRGKNTPTKFVEFQVIRQLSLGGGAPQNRATYI